MAICSSFFRWWLSLDKEIQAALIGVVGALIGGVIGALVGGHFAIRAADRANRQTEGREIASRAADVEGFVRAVAVEINEISEAYNAYQGPDVRAVDTGGFLQRMYPESDTRFPLFESNASLIGHIRDPDLRRAIVRTYSAAATMIASITANNRYLARRLELEMAFSANRTATSQTSLVVHTNALIEQAKNLKLADAALRARIAEFHSHVERVYGPAV
jgi:hypothetical protein